VNLKSSVGRWLKSGDMRLKEAKNLKIKRDVDSGGWKLTSSRWKLELEARR
jgi:hypothetical protein